MDKLGQVKRKSTTPKGSLLIFAVALFAILLVAGLSQYGGLKCNPSNTSTSDEKIDAALKPFQEFAVHVVTAINNIGFHNAQKHISETAQYFSQDCLQDYQQNYFDEDFLKMIAERRLFVTAQEVQAVRTQWNDDVSEVRTWITGKNVWSSAYTGSTKTVPFSIRLTMKKIEGAIKVTKFEFLQKQ